jgi:hypothetical protein
MINSKINNLKYLNKSYYNLLNIDNFNKIYSSKIITKMNNLIYSNKN